MWRICLAAVAVAACGIVLAVGPVGRGRAGRGTTTTVATTRTLPTPARRPAFDRADVVFARALVADDRADAAVDALAARKASTSGLRALAGARHAEDERELAAVVRARHSSGAVRGARLPETLVVNAGWHFDVVYVPRAVQRDGLEQALARHELRRGRSGALKTLARRIVRARAAETSAFRRA